MHALLPILVSLLPLCAPVSAQGVPATASNLAGTWTSKSYSVFTGKQFYNTETDRLIEPSVPGISLSFTEDGFFEAAYYRVAANPKSPDCTTHILQWQHGTYTISPNSPQLKLTPTFPLDGRQLLHDACKYKHGIYTRWNQTEEFAKLAIDIDAYRLEIENTRVKALRLEGTNGIRMQPLYFVGPTEGRMHPTRELKVMVGKEKEKAEKEGAKVRRRGLEGLASSDLDERKWYRIGGWMAVVTGGAMVGSQIVGRRRTNRARRAKATRTD